MQGAIAVHQGVNVRIVERAHDDVHGMAIERMGKRAHLPSAQVSGEKHNAGAARLRFGKVLKVFIDRNLADVLSRIAREQAEFGQQASQVDVDAAENSIFFLSAFFGEGEIEIALAYAPEARVQ